MRKIQRLWFLLVISSLMLGACSPMAMFDKTYNGKTVELKAGETFEINLEGNPTTGYTWEVDVEPDPAVLGLSGEMDYRSSSDEVGAGGVFIFPYQATGPGETTLRLVYHRPWEKDEEPLEVYELTVQVIE